MEIVIRARAVGRDETGRVVVFLLPSHSSATVKDVHVVVGVEEQYRAVACDRAMGQIAIVITLARALEPVVLLVLVEGQLIDTRHPASGFVDLVCLQHGLDRLTRVT